MLQSEPFKLSKEEQFLLRLRMENLSWKTIAGRFQTDLNKTYQVAALQMRLKRLNHRVQQKLKFEISYLKFVKFLLIWLNITRETNRSFNSLYRGIWSESFKSKELKVFWRIKSKQHCWRVGVKIEQCWWVDSLAKEKKYYIGVG